MDNNKPESNEVTPEASLVVSEQPQTHASDNAKSDTSPRPAKSSAALKLVVAITLIISILAIVAAAYLYQQLTHQHALTQQADQALKEAVTAQWQQPNDRINALELAQQQDRALANQLQQVKAEQVQLEQRISKISQRDPNQWMIAEAEYLVRMAGQKLWLEHDPQTAEQLLKTADQRIKSMQDPALLPIRKALARDINMVSSLKETDVSGAIFAIDEIIEQLPKLPLNRAEMQANAEHQQSQPMTDSVGDWKSNLVKTWQSILEDFVIVRHRSTDITPLLEPDQQWYLVENIRHKLLQAQLALYRNDQRNYQDAINMASQWIQQYYDLTAAPVKQTLAHLQTLSKLQFNQFNVKQFSATPLLKQYSQYGELNSNQGGAL